MTWVNVSKIPPNISLRAFPLFAGLEPDELAGVEGFTRRLPLSAGEALFQEGDRADRLFLIRSGRLKVFKSSPQGREQILSVLGPGEPVGEAAVFAGESFPAGAEALEASEHYLPGGRSYLITELQAHSSLPLILRHSTGCFRAL